MKNLFRAAICFMVALAGTSAEARVGRATDTGKSRSWSDREPLFCPVESQQAPAETESVLERAVRLPGRILRSDRSQLRSRLKSRLRDRLEQARSRMWMAPGGSCWHTSYESAYRAARCERKMLLVYFVPEDSGPVRQQFETGTLGDPTITEWLSYYVCARVPASQRHIHNRSMPLLADPAFLYLRGKPGLAVVDLIGDIPAYDGAVTFMRPFTSGCAPFELATILGLPRATLTQRTMIYAVRMHPDQPQSTDGELSAYLLDEAQRHSQHQANIQVQGHHGWDTRFHTISNRLGAVYTAKEVVAESWGHEDLLDAAIECVDSWRQSPGHWSAVSAPHRYYGYDMKLVANGKWYGTGIFGDGSTSVANRRG